MIDPNLGFSYHNTSGAAAATTRKILVVDDEPAMLKLIEGMLRAAGFDHLVFAHDGVDVLTVARQERPQLIIMDVMMPKGNGLRALRQLRDNTQTAGIPVILTSGFDANTLGECAQQLASFLLAKPFTPEQLISHVEKLLSVV